MEATSSVSFALHAFRLESVVGPGISEAPSTMDILAAIGDDGQQLLDRCVQALFWRKRGISDLAHRRHGRSSSLLSTTFKRLVISLHLATI